MVSTRRQRGRSLSKEISEPENDKAPDLEVKEVDEASKEIEEHDRKSAVEDSGSDEDGPVEDKPADTSDLFVLDRTGEEGDLNAAGGAKDGDRQPKMGYGVSEKKKRKRKKKSQKNPLSKLLPGYTAPMQLNTSSLDSYRPAGGIKDLQRRAQRSDSSTRGFVKEATQNHADVMQSMSKGLVAPSYTAAYSSFKKGTKRAPDKTAGGGWFNMVATPMTDELKADLAVIRNRNYLDPKKFYKSSDKQGSVVQLGTVIEGAAEYHSARLTKKQRRTNLTEEIMADPASANYARKKFRSMAQAKTQEAKQRSRTHRPKKGKRGF
jgi:hypothetical protein